jgi:hypothetical protein
MAPECGDLHDLSAFKKDMDQPETTANDPAVFKEVMNLLGMGVGGDIEIFWSFSEEKIPDASPDKAG